jgi:hypothetical protein
MKFVLRRTSTYQHGICHVLPRTAKSTYEKSTYLYVLIRTLGHLSVPVRIGMYR